MRKIWFLFAIIAVCTAMNEEEFIKGYLEGLDERKDYTDLLPCSGGVEGVANAMYTAYAWMRPLTIVTIPVGITNLFTGIRALLNVLRPCSAEYKQLHVLETKMNTIHPNILVIKIMANTKFWGDLISQAVRAYQLGSSSEMGKAFAHMPFQLLMA